MFEYDKIFTCVIFNVILNDKFVLLFAEFPLAS